MPSPFPGMDPYLESPARWPGFHNGMIAEIQGQLNAVLPESYAAVIEERLCVTQFDVSLQRTIVPDVHVRHNVELSTQPAIGDQTTLAIAEPIEYELAEEEMRETFLNIVDARDQTVVTVIELLSPANKIRGSIGQAQFAQKRQEVLASTTHWVEIDLLRGEHYVPANLVSLGDYFVTIAIAQDNHRRRHFAWPIKLLQALPTISVPLIGKDDTKLDLQSVLTTVYDRGRFGKVIDYSREAVPPLSSDYSAWAERLLSQRSQRV